MQHRYDPFIIPRPRLVPMIDWLVPLALAVAMVPDGVFVSILLLILLIFKGRGLDALAGLVLVVLGNPVLFRISGVEIVRYVPLLLGIAVLWPGLKITNVAVAWALALVGALLTFNVVAVSALPSISLFKGVLFMGVLWTLFNTQRVDFEGFASRVDRFIPLFLLVSIPTYFIPSVGFARNGLGFQGIMNQPQAFGVTVALFAAWLLHRIWTRRVTISPPLTVLAIAGLLGCILLSGARTSLLGFIIAFLLTWLIQMLRSSRRLGLKIVLGLTIGGLGVGIVTQSATLSTFLFKRGSAENVLEAADNSRGFLVRRSLDNFEAQPFLGMGFGTPSLLDEADITYAPIINVPISVALEKGIWLSATLEEQGVVGMAALLLFFAIFAIYCLRSGCYMGIPMLGFLLGSNLGEMTMFSMGGLGLLQWVLVMTAARIRG